MKKGTLNFLGRKNPSLFDTNVKMKDMDNVELVLGSGTTLDSGTASVRARPTVKHYSSTSDSFQAFAVPTPTVPHYAPALNGSKINGSVGDDQSSNGSTISVSDPIEGEIFVPAPPSMAPPPPPAEVFVLPPPEFMGDLSTLQRPSMAPPKPQSQFVSLQEDKFNFMAPPPPPKPPSTNGSVSPAPVFSPAATNIPDHPKYAPPQPPAENPKISSKKPPPKPIRISSVQSLDLPPDSPAPPPPAHTPTLSTFNPQSPAKLYSAPKSTFLNVFEEPSPKIKPKLLLEDYGAGPVVQNKTNVRPKSTEVQEDIKPPPKSLDVQEDIKPRPKSMDVQEEMKPRPKSTDVQKDIQAAVPKPVPEVREMETAPNINIPPPPSTPPQPIPERKPLTAASLKEIHKTPQTSPLLKANRPQDTKLDKPNASPTLNGKYSPLLDRKLRNISGPNAPKDTSPLALLKAAKQREKHRSTTQESSTPSQSSLLSTNSGSNLSLNTVEGRPESPKSEPIYAMPMKKPKELNPVVPSAIVLPSKAEQTKSSSPPDLPRVEDTKPDFDTSFLPPPPEFDDFDDIEPPPSMKPPDPPKIVAPSFTPAPPAPPKLPAQTPVATPVTPTPPKPAPAPPPLPQLPPPSLDTTVKSKPPPVLVKPKPAQAPAQAPPPPPISALAPPPPPASTLVPQKSALVPQKSALVPQKSALVPQKSALVPPKSALAPPPTSALAPAPLPTPATPSQATLLNILKKKMIEMDQKMGPSVGEQEPNSDDWGSPEDNEVPVIPKVNSPKNTVLNKSATLDMKELQTKVAQKHQEPNRIPIPTSNGPSRHQYGMTFTVRPGAKQPITLVSKGE